MSCFNDNHLPEPNSDWEYIARQEELERTERRREARLENSGEFREVTPAEYQEDNWIEITEFLGIRKPAATDLQLRLFDQEEVA